MTTKKYQYKKTLNVVYSKFNTISQTKHNTNSNKRKTFLQIRGINKQKFCYKAA